MSTRSDPEAVRATTHGTGVTGRTAVVTGAANGIGRAIAIALASAGARVAVCDIDADAAAHVVRDITDEGALARAFHMDVASSASISSAIDSIHDEFGTIAILVNNAGIDRIEPFVESTEQTWRRLVDVNFLGPVACTRAVLDEMTEAGFGRIVSISSDAGKVGSSGEVVYSGTKGAVIAFSKALARETATLGITVNCVCPGPTDTALLDQVAVRSQRLYDSMARSVPMKRIGHPSDIVPAVLFFAGEEASYITGQALSVSGGLTMSS